MEREDQAAGASKSPMPVILSGQLQTPGPTLSTLAFSLRESDQPCPCTPALSTRFHFDPRFQMQPGAAATSLSSLSPFLTSWSCPSPARPRSHRPVENMPRVKSTQAPERSESANPPASIPPRVGSRARRLRPASRNRSPRRRSPAPLRPRLRPCALGHPPPETEPEPGPPSSRSSGPAPARACFDPTGPLSARRVSCLPVALGFLAGLLPKAPRICPRHQPLHTLLTPWITQTPSFSSLSHRPLAYVVELKSLLPGLQHAFTEGRSSELQLPRDWEIFRCLLKPLSGLFPK